MSLYVIKLESLESLTTLCLNSKHMRQSNSSKQELNSLFIAYVQCSHSYHMNRERAVTHIAHMDNVFNTF